MQFAEFLTEQVVEQVHDGSLEILEKTGILVNNEKALKIYADHGCQVDSASLIVKIPRDIVEQYRKLFVPTFTFRGRDPQFDRTIPNQSPLIVTASSAPNIIDPDTGVERRATSTDIANIAFLVNELPGYDMFSISTLADDAPGGQFSLSRFYPALKNCLKPVRSNTPNMADLYQVLELGAIIAGGEEAYKERPIINHHYCPVVSPLTMDVESTEATLYLVEKGLPVINTIVPNAGMTSPMTLLGTLALGNAEFLANSVLIQMVRPETPLVYAVLSTVADMRTGSYTPGGYETGMSTTGAILAGADMLNMCGLLGGLMVFDYAKAVTDNEIALMLKRMCRGFESGKEKLSLDLITEIGPGGTYMDKMHTIQNMRETAFLPKLASRDSRSLWEEKRRPDAQSSAMREAHEILSGDNPAVFSKDMDAVIRARFAGLVAGDVRWEMDQFRSEMET